MASSSILANNPINTHTTTSTSLRNGSNSSTTIATRKRTYDSTLTSSSSAKNFDIAKKQNPSSMLPPASPNTLNNDDLLSIKVDKSSSSSITKDYTRTISQSEADDGEGAAAILAVDSTAANSPVKKKYAPPKTLVASGSSDIMVSKCFKIFINRLETNKLFRV